jgi:hypothetical protein
VNEKRKKNEFKKVKGIMGDLKGGGYLRGACAAATVK